RQYHRACAFRGDTFRLELLELRRQFQCCSCSFALRFIPPFASGWAARIEFKNARVSSAWAFFLATPPDYPAPLVCSAFRSMRRARSLMAHRKNSDLEICSMVAAFVMASMSRGINRTEMNF